MLYRRAGEEVAATRKPVRGLVRRQMRCWSYYAHITVLLATYEYCYNQKCEKYIYIHTYICTYIPIYTYMYIHVCLPFFVVIICFVIFISVLWQFHSPVNEWKFTHIHTNIDIYLYPILCPKVLTFYDFYVSLHSFPCLPPAFLGVLQCFSELFLSTI